MVLLRQKVVLVGDGTVGKTALTQMATSGGVAFPRNYLMTVGIDLASKEVPVGPDCTVELWLYDVSGQEVYRHMVSGFVEGLDWFVVVYDVTNKTSFESAGRWAELCRKQNPNARGVIVANKVDLKAEVAQSSAESLSKQLGVPHMAVSALRYAGITELLKHIADETAKTYDAMIQRELKR